MHMRFGWFVSTYLPSQHPFVQPIILHGAVLNSTMCMCAIYIGFSAVFDHDAGYQKQH